MNASTSAASAKAGKSPSARVNLLALCALIAPWLAAWLLPFFAQPQSFHDYADQRTWLGLPHAANVLSNLPFLIVGVLGLRYTLHGWRNENRNAFADQSTAWPYTLLFLGVLLTGVRFRLVSRATERCDPCLGSLADGAGLRGTGRRHSGGSRAAADAAVRARIRCRGCRRSAVLEHAPAISFHTW